jgi:hypothetical protein
MRRSMLGLMGLLMLTPSWADLSFSGSASRGMGGAGLALLRNPAAQSYLNPAAIAYVRGFRLGMGGFDVGVRGASLNDLFDALKLRQGSTIDIDEGARWLRRFADEDTSLTVKGDFGLIVNGFGLSVGGWWRRASSRTIPCATGHAPVVIRAISPSIRGAISLR